MTTPFPPAKLSANRAIGNWLAELSKSPMQDAAYDEAMSTDAELEALATFIANEITAAHEIGQRVARAALIADLEATIAGWQR